MLSHTRKIHGAEGNVESPQEVVRSGLCIGCGSCTAVCDPGTASMGFDRYGQLKPHGPKKWLREASTTFARICPFSKTATNEDRLSEELFPFAARHHFSAGRFINAYVGHVSEKSFRADGSSGGMTTWVLTELINSGLVDGVVHVTECEDRRQHEPFFAYTISRSAGEIRRGAKSRYYPVEMSRVLSSIRERSGRYAVVGVPCFIKAIQLLRRNEPVFRDRIAFTLGLFCGHFKSAALVESFAWQMNVAMEEIERVEFRRKDPRRPANWYNAELMLKSGETVDKDWWHLADGDWGAGFLMNSACNFCDDVVAETADASFGDAWVEPYTSDGWGTNVIITRSPEIENIISAAIVEGRLDLKEVNGDFIAATQAAGIRHRREGLAYRLSWRRNGSVPAKRVEPGGSRLPIRRKIIYVLRYLTAKWSHPIFFAARLLGIPSIYLVWARTAAALYHGAAYSRGKAGKIFDLMKEKGT